MFVQLSVAGVIVLFILSGVFIPDEIFQRAAEEILYDDNDENNNENSEAVTYWKKALGSLDITLAVSAGLGTLLTAILSYRFSHGRLACMGRRFQQWMRKKEKTPVTVIMKPAGSEFQTESKECLADQFHEATENCSNSNYDGYSTADGKDGSDCYANSSVISDGKAKEIDLNSGAFNELLKAAEKKIAGKLIDGEPKYQTLEARLVAVEGSLMRDIDSRMKIFEQQLEEFRTKIRSGSKVSTDDSGSEIMSEFRSNFHDCDSGSETKPPKCVLEAVATTFKNAVPSKRRSSSKNGPNPFSDQIGDLTSDTESRDESTSGILTRGDSFSARSSDAGSETISDCGTGKKSSIPTSLHVVRKKGMNQQKNVVTPETRSDQAMKRQESPSVNQQVNCVSSKKSVENSPTRISSNQLNRRGPRSRQQLKAILQQTTEKLSQRTSNKLKQTNKT